MTHIRTRTSTRSIVSPVPWVAQPSFHRRSRLSPLCSHRTIGASDMLALWPLPRSRRARARSCNRNSARSSSASPSFLLSNLDLRCSANSPSLPYADWSRLCSATHIRACATLRASACKFPTCACSTVPQLMKSGKVSTEDSSALISRCASRSLRLCYTVFVTAHPQHP